MAIGVEPVARRASPGGQTRREAPGVDQLLSTILDAALDAIIAIDERGRIREMNPAAVRLLGVAPDAAIGRHVADVVLPPAQRAAHRRAINRYLATRQPRVFRVDISALRSDGTILPVELAVAELELPGENLSTVYLRDRTAQAGSESGLTEPDSRFRELVETLPVVIYEAHGGVEDGGRYVSPQVENLLGFSGVDWLRDPQLWFKQIHPDDQGIVLAHDRALRARPGERARCEYRVITKTNETLWVRDEAIFVPGEDGEPGLARGVIVDISERKSLEARLSRHAFYDSLTELPNRAMFLDRLDRAIARGPRTPHGVIGVLFLDVDDFKVVNDTLGHAAGDALLAEIGRRLVAAVRPSDIPARLGGDEFTILLDDLHTPDEALQVAARVRDDLARPILLGDRDVHVSVSVGVGITSDRRASAQQLLSEADIAMYRAKQSGKARAELFDPEMSAEAWRRLNLQRDLRLALERDEFVVHYQPIVSLESGRIEQVEALVRWVHPTRGVILPSEFISFAESSDLISRIDRLVLREGCRQLAQWRTEHAAARSLTLAVNVSPRDCRDGGLIEDVLPVLAEFGLPPSSLTIEITESAELLGARSVRELLGRLTRAGVEVVIDDFGVGYSGLDYIKRFRVNGLKIDRSFVAGVAKKREDRAIVTAALAFGGALGLSVVAEGIETHKQLQQLREMGCTSGQGFLIARPAPADVIGRLVAERSIGTVAAAA